MRLIIVKILCVLVCVPVYPFAIYAEWYGSRAWLGGKFDLKTASADYWRDVKETLAQGRTPK